MDLDLELAISDRPSRSSSSRPTRFQPKAKFRPKPKLEAESDSPSSSKKQKEDLSLLSPHPPQPSQPIEASNEEVNAQESGGDVDGDGGVAGDDGDGVVREIDVFFKPAPLDKDAHVFYSLDSLLLDSSGMEGYSNLEVLLTLSTIALGYIDF
ncbi:hypothetical protein ACLOJK_035496 [Asimina triloba]